MDKYGGNFRMVEILRKVEGLGEFQRGMFSDKFTIPRKAEDLEKHAATYLIYVLHIFHWSQEYQVQL